MDIMLTRIIGMCKMRKITQKDLTDALGLRSSAFSEWKSGKSKSYTKYVHHIACVLGTTAEYLQGTTDNIEPLNNSHLRDESEEKSPAADKEASSPSPVQESSEPELSEQEQQLVNIFRAASPEARIEMIAAMVHVRDRHKKTYTVYRAAHSVDNAPHRLELRSAAEIEKLQNAPTVKNDDEL